MAQKAMTVIGRIDVRIRDAKVPCDGPFIGQSTRDSRTGALVSAGNVPQEDGPRSASQEAMGYPIGVEMVAGDLAGIVDVESFRSLARARIEGCEFASWLAQESMLEAAVIIINPGDGTFEIEPLGVCIN